MHRFHLLIFAVLLLASCATPNVNVPSGGKADIQHERELQAAQAARESQSVKVETRDTGYYMEQLQRIAPRIQKAGIEVCQGIGYENCKFGFKLVDDKTINAFADGNVVNITTGIMAFAGSDDAVASVLAHEYAHNVLGHVQSTERNVTIGALGGVLAQRALESQGIELGNLADLGAQVAQLRYSKAFEQEADHVGLYICKRAGYDLDSMPDIWRRMAAHDPNGIYTGSTHPTYPERYVAMQQTINEIREKEKNGQPLLPTFMNKKRYF